MVPAGFAQSLLACAAIAALGCGGESPPASSAAAVAAAPDDLCRRIDAVLRHTRDGRLLDAGVHGAWQVVHGILAFGPDFPIAVKGGTTAALGYLLDGGSLVGWKLRPGSPGVIAIVEEGSTMGQGHPDQWLGYLSQCGVSAGGDRLAGGIPLDAPLVVGGRTFTVADLLAQAQHDIRAGPEATWRGARPLGRWNLGTAPTREAQRARCKRPLPTHQTARPACSRFAAGHVPSRQA